MKTWLWALLVAAAGLGVGAAVARSRLGAGVEIPLPKVESRTASAEKPAASAAPAGTPRVAVDAEVYDFGAMDVKDEKQHEFVLRNTGTAPLILEKKGTSCKCAVSDFTSKTLAPGESTKVTLKWHAQDFFGPYEQSAVIRANDPKRAEVALRVKGRVTTALRADPAEVVFGEMAAGQPAQTTVHLWAYRSDQLKVKQIGFQEADTSEFFEVAPKRLSAEQIRQEKDAKSGYALKIVVKPGLPLGRFRQTILIDTNVPGFERLEVPVKGKIASDISIVGRDWDLDRQCLRLGVLKRDENADRTLLLVVRGRYRRAIDFEIAEAFPTELVRAELGEKTAVGAGVVVRVPLAIHVSTQAGPVNYLGSQQSPTGYVLLNTNHPLVPKIKIPISFAVEGG